MTRPILFLDIDGVLNSRQWFDARCQREGSLLWSGSMEQMLDPAAVERLNGIVEATGCMVILSSSWRLDCGHRGTQAWLRKVGYRHTLDGETPYSPGHDRRGDEVGEWLRSHAPDCRCYVLLDDEPEENHPGKWVATSFATGLTDLEMHRVIDRLGRRT